MAIVRCSSSEWRTIVEDERWFVLVEFKLSLECANFLPSFEDDLFFARKADRHILSSDILLRLICLLRESLPEWSLQKEK